MVIILTNKQRADKICMALEKEYPLPECTLDYARAWELLVAVRLAAQCTDARVNIVTRQLFSVYPTPKALADAPVEKIEEIVRPCGLGATKARDISKAMKLLVYQYDGRVPDDLNTLLTFPGVGRKSANLIVGDVFGKPAIVCDTHCIRLANRFGLADSQNPAVVEKQLREVLDPQKSNDFCHRTVLHGRAVCSARSFSCEKCCVFEFCKSAKKA